MRLPGISALLLTFGLATSAAAQRLPTIVSPEHYDLEFTVDLQHERFEGDERIRVELAEPSEHIVLNAADLEFRDVEIAAAGATQRARVSLDAAAETATLAVPAAIPKGPAEIHVRYHAQLNDKLRGLYLSKGGDRKYAVTQFESTDARRAFPSFDEPSFKATFALTLVVGRGDIAISNGRLLSDTMGPTPHQHTMKFATTPKMSTYLVAIAVGDFQCLEGGADDIPIRICATPDKKALGAIALESAEWILKFYDNYYAIKYPFKKLDVVAVPDFAAGAMENTAAIFYREADLLADSRTASVETRKNVASVLAHEMAHQWFGDLVTMRWWDDLWLNEGFATWMANHPLAAWKPEWNIPVDEADENQLAMSLDSLKATRAVHAAVDKPAEIEEAFDAIAYQKGAAVLRMIEHYVGPDVFRKGINAYLQAHAYGNATSQDFWTAIAETSGKPVDRILPTFVNQAGVPVVDVAVGCTAARTTLTLDQERFLPDAASNAVPPAERWEIPLCIKSGAGDAACSVMTGDRATFELREPCAPWVFANAGAQGYYRTAYDPAALRALAPHIEEALTAPERLSLIGDEWAIVRAGRHSIADYMALSAGFAREPIGGVLHQVVDRIAFAGEYLTTPSSRERFAGWIRQQFGPALEELGVASKPGDDDNRRERRAALVLLVGNHGQDPTVAAQARDLLERSLAGGPALDAAVANAIVQVAAEHGDSRLYRALEAAAGRRSSPEEQYRYLYALAAFPDPKLIEQALDFSRSPDLRSQDAAIYLSLFFRNPAARDRAWSYVKAHWAELESKIAISGGETNLVASLSAFCDAKTRDDIRSFFAAPRLPAASRTLNQTMERISNCITLREKEAPELTRWLDHASTPR